MSSSSFGPADGTAPRGALRVLVADHDPDVRATLKERLDAEGFDVAVATSVDDVVEMVDRTRFDVVILDPAVSSAGCQDLMFFIHHRRPGTSIVLLGDEAGWQPGALARLSGAAAWFSRRVPVADLAGALQSIVPQPVLPPQLAHGAWSSPAGAAQAGTDSALRIVIHAGRRGRLRDVLDVIASSVVAERIVIVGLRHEAEAIEHEVRRLAARPHVLLQPRDQGSAAAILLGAYYVRRNAPDAPVAVVPAVTSGVPGPALVDALEEGARFVEGYPRWIVVLGERAAPGRARELRIVPASVLSCSETTPVWRAESVCTTRRPPTPAQRAAAFRGTGVVVAKAARLVAAARNLVPHLHAPLLQAVPLIGSGAERHALQRAYAIVPRLDFAAAILAPAVSSVAVAAPAGATWIALDGPQPFIRTRISTPGRSEP